MGKRDDRTLDEYIEHVRIGADPKLVLARCPEQLRPVLQTAIAISQVPQVVPSAAGKARGRRKLDKAVRKERARRERLPEAA